MEVALQKFKPDIVIFERFILEEMFGHRVRKVLPNALRVIGVLDWRDNYDVHTLFVDDIRGAPAINHLTLCVMCIMAKTHKI